MASKRKIRTRRSKRNSWRSRSRRPETKQPQFRPSAAQLRILVAGLLRAQDEERQRLSRELHDVTGQKLAYQAILLSRIARDPAIRSSEALTGLLAECQDLTEQVSGETRALCYLLFPPLLGELGLLPAVRAFTQGFITRTGIPLDMQLPDRFARLSVEVERTLFFVLQESLTNVHRHAKSAKATVRLRLGQNDVTLEIEDFGCGFVVYPLLKQPNATQFPRLGIPLMHERARQARGRLEIVSRRDKGTRVSAVIPTLLRGPSDPEALFETSVEKAV